MVIATVSTLMTVGAGAVMTLVDHDNFESIGPGLWWAVQTVTTVGYGDDVPTSFAGQLVAVLVMLLGVAFLTSLSPPRSRARSSNVRAVIERPRRPRGPPPSSSASSISGSSASKPPCGGRHPMTSGSGWRQ